jgi:DNA-binding XRE family transcriptional regulator
MTPHIGQVIRRAREALGLEAALCATEVGLSDMHYYDLEAYDHEFFDNISLGTARRLCDLLGLDVLELTAAHVNGTIRERSPATNAMFHSRHALISKTRLGLNLTEESLGDAIGFETITVRQLERTPDFIESLPIRVVVNTAIALGLDPGLLIGSPPQRT